MNKYNPSKIERKWQRYWQKNKLYKTPADATRADKMYILPQLPYPSGSGLHVGHAEVYTACDIYARYQRMLGKKVLQVIGWDAFGLPAENYAIKTNIHPRKSTDNAIDTFRDQIKALGISVDWDREVGSHNPDYYHWTQWFFLLFYKRGLAYRKKQSVNWCDSCKTVLANEQVTSDGKCERCETVVTQREMEQWYIKITDYAERLLKDLDKVDWPEESKKRQRDWIGKSEGVNFKMKMKGKDINFEVFDSVPQTYTAQTFAVIAPEHQLLPELMRGSDKEKVVAEFVERVKRKKMEANKYDVEQEIKGVFTGLYMDDPYGTGDIPLWVASFAIAEYGSGVVGCSAHDERDFAFAKKYGIPLRPVMFPENEVEAEKVKNLEYCYHHEPEAILIFPEKFNGRKWGEAREDIIDHIEKIGIGKRAVQYKLRDWSVSRQRFWGAPIPMLHNDEIKNKKYHYVFLHGYKGTAERNNGESDYNWQHWLRTKLEKYGHTVFCPDLPNTDGPKVDEQADFVIKNTIIDENTILVGQSLGGVVVYKLLEKVNKKVAKVLLVDPVVTPKFPDRERPVVEKSCDWKFDWEKIKQASSEFVILGDAEFETIFEKDLRFLAQQLDGNLVLSRPMGRHFTGAKEPMIDELLEQTGWMSVPESDLPVILPNDVDFKPTGESPLNYSKSFNKGVEKKYGAGWKREPDTLDTFMCSSWYYFRYLDPRNDKQFASPEALKAWMPVDFYLGGPEHVNGHLLYSRFFTKVLFDAGYIDFDEPFLKHRHQGLILGEDNRKMSKRWGNVINPTDVVNEFGADTFRMYEMFMGPLEQDKPWDTNGVRGVRRFLERVWALRERVVIPAPDRGRGQAPAGIQGKTDKRLDSRLHGNDKLEILLNQTIKKVTEDVGGMKFNTAISQMMTLVNELGQAEKISDAYYKIFLKLLCPFAPHLCEELWSELGNKTSITTEPWPVYDPSKITDSTFTLAVQINGKLRDTIEVPTDISEDEAKQKALASEKVQKWLLGKEPKKIIYVKGKLVSVVV